MQAIGGRDEGSDDADHQQAHTEVLAFSDTPSGISRDIPTMFDAMPLAYDIDASEENTVVPERKTKKLVVAARAIMVANVFADFARVDPSSVPSVADAADLQTPPAVAGAASELIEAESTGEPGAKKGKLSHTLRRVMMMGIVNDNPFIKPYTLDAPALEPSKLKVFLDVIGQTTISWGSPIALNGVGGSELPAGACNLYLFPTVTLTSGTTMRPEGRQLDTLKALLVCIATDPSCDFVETPDVVGAFPIHALLVANTDASIALVELMIRIAPTRLITQTHTDHRAGFPLFTGESNLHVCAVNCREELLCTLIDIMMESVERKEALLLLRSQCEGVFFLEAPMCTYGGTALSYACAFSLRKAVAKLLSTGYCSLNDHSSACEISGYMPLHTVVGLGLTDMYDWLLSLPELPVRKRANAEQRSLMGRHSKETHGLIPAQLAARVGDLG